MDHAAIQTSGSHRAAPFTLRDATRPLFRHRRLVGLIFGGVFCGALVSFFLLPRKYESEMKILVTRDRIDAAVTPYQNAAVMPAPAVSQDDLNSEVELLKSRDLLQKVVLSCGLDAVKEPTWSRMAGRVDDLLSASHSTPGVRLARAVDTLRSQLIAEPIQNTTLIRVVYASRNPQLSARVLRKLAVLYQEKHGEVHRPAGAYRFFVQETASAHNALSAAETQLEDFDAQGGIVAPQDQEQLTLQELSRFQAEFQTDQASASASEARIRALRRQEAVTPKRQTTQERTLDNAQLLANLQSTLVSLQLKRTDMLMKYAPTYPPVAAVNTQIAETKKAIVDAQRSPADETTTDRVPAQDWMATELAKSEADHAQFEAEAAATARIVHQYQQEAAKLSREAAFHDELAREVKTAEDNYLLYRHKREEARISDALDSKRIVNVSIAEAPTVPALPTRHFAWFLIGGFFTAGVVSIGTAYAVDQWDPSFRTSDEVSRYLDIDVLASIPTDLSKKYLSGSN